MREKMNVRKLFRMTAFIRAGRRIVCHLDVQKIVEAFDGWVVFNADGRDHCIIGEDLARRVDVVVDHRIGDALEFCANAANGTFPGCLTASQPFCSLGLAQ